MDSIPVGQREVRNITANIMIWLVNSAALLLASAVLEGVEIEPYYMAFFAALALSVLTLVIEPVLFLLTLPINVATFGLFTVVLNGIVLLIVERLVGGFHFAGSMWQQFGWAVAAALVVGFFRVLVQTLLVRLRIADRKT